MSSSLEISWKIKRNQEKRGGEAHGKEKEKERKRTKFLELNPWFKNSFLVKLLPSARASTSWYNWFGKKPSLVASGRSEKKVRINAFSYVMMVG